MTIICFFCTEDICNIVNQHKSGKSSGPDGISAEFLKFSHSRLYVMFLLFLTHGLFLNSSWRQL